MVTKRTNVRTMTRVKGTPSRPRESSPKLMLATIAATAVAMVGVIVTLRRRTGNGQCHERRS